LLCRVFRLWALHANSATSISSDECKHCPQMNLTAKSRRDYLDQGVTTLIMLGNSAAKSACHCSHCSRPLVTFSFSLTLLMVPFVSTCTPQTSQPPVHPPHQWYITQQLFAGQMSTAIRLCKNQMPTRTASHQKLAPRGGGFRSVVSVLSCRRGKQEGTCLREFVRQGRQGGLQDHVVLVDLAAEHLQHPARIKSQKGNALHLQRAPHFGKSIWSGVG